LLFRRIPFKYGRHFDYWNQPQNMRTRVCYLNCHEAGLCCYLVIHIEYRLHPLQLIYFHLCPIYWRSLLNPCLSRIFKNCLFFLKTDIKYVKSSNRKTWRRSETFPLSKLYRTLKMPMR
jgi:hypothetical protein